MNGLTGLRNAKKWTGNSPMRSMRSPLLLATQQVSPPAHMRVKAFRRANARDVMSLPEYAPTAPGSNAEETAEMAGFTLRGNAAPMRLGMKKHPASAGSARRQRECRNTYRNGKALRCVCSIYDAWLHSLCVGESHLRPSTFAKATVDKSGFGGQTRQATVNVASDTSIPPSVYHSHRWGVAKW